MALLYGCDISNFQGTISPSVASCLKNSVDVVVVRLSTERQQLIDIAREQIQACQGVGLTVLGYPWAYFNTDPQQQFEAVMDAYDDLDVAAILMDCEDEQNVLSPSQNVAWLHHALSAYISQGYPAGIYSGPYYWSHFMGGDQSFGDYVSWVANPNGRVTLDDVQPLGGARVVGKQYSWDASLCGISPIDLDVFDADWIASLSGGLSVDEKNELDYLRNWYGLVKGDYMDDLQKQKDVIMWSGSHPQNEWDAINEIQNIIETIRKG